MTHPKGYFTAQIALHWIVAVLVAAQFIFHEAIVDAWRAIERGTEIAFDPLVMGHVIGGVLILGLVVWRLALRLTRGTPLPPENEPAGLGKLAHVVHWGFYAVLAGMSVTGGLAWFGGLATAAEVHEAGKAVLLAMIALHVAAVPFHRFVLKNNVMARIVRPAS
jgi:cytochrome b561